MIIPASDMKRSDLFGDFLPGVLKHIIVKINGVETIYTFEVSIRILLTPKDLQKNYMGNPHVKLFEIHQKYKFIGGNIADEYLEQLMAVSFIRPGNNVLEIGSNIGRNTLTIANLLIDSHNLVTLETDPQSVKILENNRDNNDLKFQIINATLSKHKLFQKDGNVLWLKTHQAQIIIL